MSQSPVPAIPAVRTPPETARLAPVSAPDPAIAKRVTGSTGPLPPLGSPPRGEADAVLALTGRADSQEAPVQAYARFTIDEDTRIVTVSIIDTVTHEVIRQAPPEEMVKLARIMQEQAGRRERGATVDPLAAARRPAVDHKV